MNATTGFRFAFLLVIAAVAQLGCETTSPQAGSAETAGREVDQAMRVAGNETGRALDVAQSETGRALNVAQEHTSHALNVAGREVNRASKETGVFLEKFGTNLSDGTFW